MSPPRLARWLLARVLPPGVHGDTILGDLVEELNARVSHISQPGPSPEPRGPSLLRQLAAWLWYWRQALSLAASYALTRARRRFARTGRAAEPERTTMLDTLAQDLRYAVRTIAKAPGFTAVVLVTVALGIGASTAIFSIVDAVILRPLPYPDADRLVVAAEEHSGDRMSIAWPNFIDIRARTRSYEGLALYASGSFTLTGLDKPQRLDGRRVTADFFRVLGVSPVAGRGFIEADDRLGAEPVVIISDGLWRKHLGGDRKAVGRSLAIEGRPHTVVGILPPRFRFLRDDDLYLTIAPMIAPNSPFLDRGNHMGYYALGRLKPGVTAASAASELAGIARQLEREHPNTNSGNGARVERLADFSVRDVRLALLVLLGAVGFLLLMACVNVTNLLVARGAARQHELLIRVALGCGRRRLVRQLLLESVLLAAAGGVLGVVVGAWLLDLLVAMAPDNVPRIDEVGLDRAALAFAAAAAATCGLLFGAIPALQASAMRRAALIMRASRVASAGLHSYRVRRTLMAAEVALALMLLTGAGLMIRTMAQLTRVDPGFRASELLTMWMAPTGPEWNGAKRVALYDAVLERARAIPGVTEAALSLSLPIDGSGWNSVFLVGDKPVPARADLPSAAFTPVSTRFFETMGIRLVKGRGVDTSDRPDSRRVAIVNQTLARRLWGDENPVGKRLKQGWPETPESASPWREVVGVVADVKLEGLAAETPLQVYLPVPQDPSGFMALIVRSSIPPATLISAVESAVHQVNANLPVFAVQTMDEYLESAVARERVSMVVLIVFAVVALTLASVGLYGVVSHGVTERTHEFGVRMALGAERGHVLRMVVRQGLATAFGGVVVGLAGALALSRFIEDLLFGVEPTDPATLVGVVMLLLAVAIAACYLPARRATRVDPTIALRAE